MSCGEASEWGEKANARAQRCRGRPRPARRPRLEFDESAALMAWLKPCPYKAATRQARDPPTQRALRADKPTLIARAGVAGAVEDAAGKGVRHFAVGYDGDAVDEDEVHADGELIRIVERGEIADPRGIEDDDVGPHAEFERAAIREAHALRGKRGKFANRFGQSEQMLFLDVQTDDARKRAVRARMRVLMAENSRRRDAGVVVVDGNPGLLKGEFDVGLAHAED